MLKLPSWTRGNFSRLLGCGARRVSAAMALVAATLCATAQTPTPTPLPTVQFTSSVYSVNENAGAIRIAVSGLGDRTVPFSVNYTATDGTARSGQDFIARSGVLDFGAGEMQKTFDVFILNNEKTNDVTTIILQLSNPVGADLGFPDAAEIDILDDESGISGISAGVVEFSSSVYVGHDSEGEDGRGDFYPGAKEVFNYPGIVVTVVRKNGSRGAILVDYDTIPAPQTWIGPQARENVQYRPVSGTVELSDYQMSAQFLIPTLKYTNFFNDAFYNSSCVITTTNAAGETTWYKIADGCPPTDERYLPFFVLQTNTDNGTRLEFYSTNCLSSICFPGVQITPTFNFQVRLSNVRAHPAEDPDVVKPSLGGLNTADVGVVWVDNTKAADGSIRASQNSQGFSLERAHYATFEGEHNYNIQVNRDGRVIGDTFVRYRVNNANEVSIPGDHNNHQFQLEAGSDYAHPFVDHSLPGTPDFRNAPGKTNSPWEGSIRWSQTEFGPKPLQIPIVEDNLVEFNEDMKIGR